MDLFILSLSAHGLDSEIWCIEQWVGYQLIPVDGLQSNGRFRNNGKYLRNMFMRRLREKQ